MRVPTTAPSDIQQALREVWAALDRLGVTGALNLDLKGKRTINAGDAIDQTDYVTKRQLARLAEATTTSGANGEFTNLVVHLLARFEGTVFLPHFSDGTKHHAILFVDERGALAVNEDGAFALDLNLTDGLLEIGYGLKIKWFNQAGLDSPAAGIVRAFDDLGTDLLRLVLGADDATGIALRKNGTTLEIRLGGGGVLTNLTCANLTASNVATSGGAAVFSSVVIGTDPGGGDPLRVGGGATLNGGIATSDTTLHHSHVALGNGAAGNVGTLNTAPAAGNPTKWIPIDDNGTTRYIPAW